MEKNIFNIQNAEDCICKVMSFTDGHKILTISVLNQEGQDQNLHLHFGRVAYYSGPIYWKGANFCFASRNEYQQFLETTGNKMSELKDHVLYTVTTADGILCQIFALFGSKEDEDGYHPGVKPSDAAF